MANLVLYRKYRPQTFSEIIGQEHIVQTLTNALSTGMVSHAYLFSGPRGSGKTSLARLLAKAVNCEVRSRKYEEIKKSTKLQTTNYKLQTTLYEPCNTCQSCLEINQGQSLDLTEIDAASHRGIDEIRELREGIKFSPTKSKYKVFIIDESHQLTKEAANALLKTLEEPPSHAIFILATTEIQKMIPTIISRCQRFDFRRLNLPEILKRLEIISGKENLKIENRALELIALNSGGALRDAEGLLDQVITFSGKGKEIKAKDIKDFLGIVDIALVSRFVDFLSKKDASRAIHFLQENFDRGVDPQEFSKTLINYLRQLLISKINPDLSNPILSGLTKEEQLELQELYSAFQEPDLRQILNLFLEAENKMRYSSIPQLPLELATIEYTQKKE